MSPAKAWAIMATAMVLVVLALFWLWWNCFGRAWLLG